MTFLIKSFDEEGKPKEKKKNYLPNSKTLLYHAREKGNSVNLVINRNNDTLDTIRCDIPR